MKRTKQNALCEVVAMEEGSTGISLALPPDLPSLVESPGLPLQFCEEAASKLLLSITVP